MDNQSEYYKDGVARVLELLRDTFGDYFKEYYDDEIDELLESNMPCIMVKETIGDITVGASSIDNVDEQVVIILALSLKDDVGAQVDGVLTGTRLRRLVKGRYPKGHAKAGQYHEKTVMHALRTNFTLATSSDDDDVIDNVIETDMDVARRGEVRSKEAYVTLKMRTLAYVPDRS